MILDHLTITGADDAITLHDLQPLIERFPLMEWAILIAPAKTGQSRFPTEAWRRALYTAYPKVSMKRSVHLCGSAIRSFVEGDVDLWREVVEHHQRAQLNVNARRMQPRVLDGLVAQAERLANDGVTVIVQHNDANKDLVQRFMGIANHRVLFDASGGRGVAPEAWEAPLAGHGCGYSGGLGPDNVGHVLDQLQGLLPEEEHTWIDMESRVRTLDDAFDMNKVTQVGVTVDAWLAQRALRVTNEESPVMPAHLHAKARP